MYVRKCRCRPVSVRSCFDTPSSHSSHNLHQSENDKSENVLCACSHQSTYFSAYIVLMVDRVFGFFLVWCAALSRRFFLFSVSIRPHGPRTELLLFRSTVCVYVYVCMCMCVCVCV